jgi:hypothetical protein
MRKEDRIRQDQNRDEQPRGSQSPPPRREQEQMKGSGSTGQQKMPPRPSGKLPLPD